MSNNEDILTEFKAKINDAIALVSKIPVEQKAEVWNFWELITITVKLFTQVYIVENVSVETSKHEFLGEREKSRNEEQKKKKETITYKKRGRKKLCTDITVQSGNKNNDEDKIHVSDDVSESCYEQNKPQSERIEINLSVADLVESTTRSSEDLSQQEELSSVLSCDQVSSCSTASVVKLVQDNNESPSAKLEEENIKDGGCQEVVCVEIISADHVTQAAKIEKENKVPTLKLKKMRKKIKIENAYENAYVEREENNCEDIRTQGRRSSRQKRKVQREDYLYEETTSNDKHSQIQNKDGQFKCEDCGKILSNLTSLRVHSRQHTGQRPFACRICGKTFSTNGNRLRHETGHKGEKNFQCEDCQKWFSTAINLQIHKRVHTGEKPFVCNLCDKRFTQRGSLKAHMDLHRGEKKYLCTICGRAFTQKTNLDTHVIRHNKNNRQFKCQHCNHSFFTKGELERHSFKHTKERPFLCDFCPKSFTRAQYLKEHKTLHVKSKPYTCQKCDETFVDMASLRKHKQWHRVNESQEKPTLEGEIPVQEEIQDDGNIQETCIVTYSEVTGMKQIIMASDKDLPPDVRQQFVDSAHIDSDTMEITHMVPVVAEIDQDGNLTQVDSIDDSSQDIYQITFLDANSDSEHSNIITAVDFSAMNLLANATAQQFN